MVCFATCILLVRANVTQHALYCLGLGDRACMYVQAKSKDTEYELAQQRVELEQLRQRQQRLEQRNVLLERLTHINHQQQQQQYAGIDQASLVALPVSQMHDGSHT